MKIQWLPTRGDPYFLFHFWRHLKHYFFDCCCYYFCSRYSEFDALFICRQVDGHLEIHNITLSQAGEYECIVKTSVGRVSAKSEVFVYGPPGIVGGVQVHHCFLNLVLLGWFTEQQLLFKMLTSFLT